MKKRIDFTYYLLFIQDFKGIYFMSISSFISLTQTMPQQILNSFRKVNMKQNAFIVICTQMFPNVIKTEQEAWNHQRSPDNLDPLHSTRLDLHLPWCMCSLQMFHFLISFKMLRQTPDRSLPQTGWFERGTWILCKRSHITRMYFCNVLYTIVRVFWIENIKSEAENFKDVFD